VDLDTLSEFDTFVVYGNVGTSPSRGNIYFNGHQTMLGYLTGFQLDIPQLYKKRFDFSAIIPDKIEKEN
jgi:hypothetical protein